jgi:hypothetical protein
MLLADRGAAGTVCPAPVALILNCSTRPRSCTAISASSFAAFCDSCALVDVPRAASATPAMLCVISSDPLAASATFLVISLVVALCSSTAVAMVLEMSLDLVDDSGDAADGVDCALGVGLNGGDFAADVLGGLRGLFS